MKHLTAIAATTTIIATLIAGCGKCPEGGFAKKAGEKVEDALKIKVTVERQKPIKAELAAATTLAGMTMNTFKPLPPNDNGRAGFSAYILSTKAVSGQLIAKAIDKDGKEIGRSAADLDLANDDARYFNFWFPSEMDQRKVEAYQIDLKK